MTQTNHSELMNDMDRATNDLVRLMTSVGRMSLDRTALQENIATLTQENFRLQCEISNMRQCAQDDKEMYEQIVNEKNLTLAEEEKYADNLHDSMTEMKMTILQLNDSLAKEKEEKRKESEQLRTDLAAMYTLRDEMKAERDQMKTERDQMKAERDQMKTERDGFEKEALDMFALYEYELIERKRANVDRDDLKEKYRAACVELRDEYEAHSKTIAEHNDLLRKIGMTENINQGQLCDDDCADSIS